MYAKVIPAVKLPRTATSYDYLTADLPVKRGSLVMVPWRRRTVLGVVVETSERSAVDSKRLKPIQALAGQRHLPEEWVSALEWSADRYLCAPGTVAKCFLPTLPKRFKGFTDTLDQTAPNRLPLRTANNRVRLYSDPDDKRLALAEAVERCLAEGRSAIVLAPHRTDIRDAVDCLADKLTDEPLEIHGGLAAGQLWRNWQSAIEGHGRLVIGSRMAAMAPLPDLGLIAVLESESLDHKQYDQNPRYDARILAERRTAAASAELLLMTPAPRVEEAVVLGQGFRLEDAASAPAEVVLADVSARGPDWTGPLAPVSVDRLLESLQNGKNALIYHNRRGTAGALACADCRYVARCQKCNLAMAVHPEGLHCHRCGDQRSLPLQCPECLGASLRPIGWGTAAIQADLKKKLPGTAVLRFDKDTDRITDLPKAPNVIIGSRQLIHDLNELKGGDFGAVIATSAEDLLRQPGFRTLEEAWGIVRRLRYLAGQAGIELVLQTLTPDDPRVRALARDAKPFLMDELAVRRQAGYPPCGRLVLVVSRAATEKQAERLAFKAKWQLAEAVRNNGARSVISDPMRGSRPISHGQWRQVIAIRAPHIGPQLLDALRQLPGHYVIETDPETAI